MRGFEIDQEKMSLQVATAIPSKNISRYVQTSTLIPNNSLFPISSRLAVKRYVGKIRFCFGSSQRCNLKDHMFSSHNSHIIL